MVPAQQAVEVMLEGDVLCHAEVGEQREILINHLDTEVARLPGSEARQRRTVAQRDAAAAVRGMYPGDNF